MGRSIQPIERRAGMRTGRNRNPEKDARNSPGPPRRPRERLNCPHHCSTNYFRADLSAKNPEKQGAPLSMAARLSTFYSQLSGHTHLITQLFAPPAQTFVMPDLHAISFPAQQSTTNPPPNPPKAATMNPFSRKTDGTELQKPPNRKFF